MIEYRNASLDELKLILDWAAEEGWNPGQDDAEAFYAADPYGFFVATKDDLPIAGISVVNHNAAFAFLGLYIVKPDERGQGIGYELWQHALRHAEGRTIGLDGVPEQQTNYTSSGFRFAGSTMRFSGDVLTTEPGKLRIAHESDIPILVAEEANASGVRKEAYLSAWFTNTGTRLTLIGDQGFCTVRRCRVGAKIGPLIATNAEECLSLMLAASAAMGPQIIIDVPQQSKVLADLCRELGLEAGFETTRMYRGSRPSEVETINAVTSLELG